jgi:hypothetical protein
MRSLIRFTLCFVVCLLLVQVAPAQKKQQQRRWPAAWGVPDIYSNLSLEQETGDIGGMQVVLHYSYGGTWATVIIASGVPDDPVLVPVKVDYPNIEFTLPDVAPYEGYGKFTGKIIRAGMLLWNGGQRMALLRRQRS